MAWPALGQAACAYTSSSKPLRRGKGGCIHLPTGQEQAARLPEATPCAGLQAGWRPAALASAAAATSCSSWPVTQRPARWQASAPTNTRPLWCSTAGCIPRPAGGEQAALPPATASACTGVQRRWRPAALAPAAAATTCGSCPTAQRLAGRHARCSATARTCQQGKQGCALCPAATAAAPGPPYAATSCACMQDERRPVVCCAATRVSAAGAAARAGRLATPRRARRWPSTGEAALATASHGRQHDTCLPFARQTDAGHATAATSCGCQAAPQLLARQTAAAFCNRRHSRQTSCSGILPAGRTAAVCAAAAPELHSAAACNCQGRRLPLGPSGAAASLAGSQPAVQRGCPIRQRIQQPVSYWLR